MQAAFAIHFRAGKRLIRADLGFVLVDDDVLPANYGIGEKQDWTKK